MQKHRRLFLFGGGALFLLLIGILGGALLKRYTAQKGIVVPVLDDVLEHFSAEVPSPVPFATYTTEKTPVRPSIQNTKVSLNELSNLGQFEKADSPFNSEQKNRLSADNFFIRPNTDDFYQNDPDEAVMRSDDWTALYKKIGGGPIWDRAPQNSVFVSSDLNLHVYHKLLEKEMEYIEQSTFYPKLQKLSQQLLKDAVEQRQKAQTDDEKASYDRLTSYFAVPTAMLNASQEDLKTQGVEDAQSDSYQAVLTALDGLKPQLSETSYQRAQSELKLIFDHQEAVTPPLFADVDKAEQLQLTEDYSQYTPRSHYAKNALLRTYFRSMIWYGRTNFVAKSPSLTRDALHITQLMNKPDQQKLWDDIYQPTAFLVGQSDDLGIREYSSLLSGKNTTPSVLSEKAVSQAQANIAKLPKPQIMSSIVVDQNIGEKSKDEVQASTQGFRLFGQRFTPDAFVFTTLTQGQEAPDKETGESLPSSTTGLLVMSALGNKTADQFVPVWIDQNAHNSKNVLNKRLNTLKAHFNGLDTATWNQNLYWSWLYTLQPLFVDYSDQAGYPFFVRNQNWNRKNLQTALGSWTELKHDTLLYAKQSYAEMGAGGPDEMPPVPKGYVEPNVEFFDRLLALSKYTQTGLKSRGVLPQEFEGRHEKFDKSLTFFRSIAVKELENQKISDEDFEQLRNEAGWLDDVVRPLPNEQSIERNARSALIADVHTDAVKGEILYEAVGIPNYVYVAVKDVNGTRLTKGLVYSYYEFTGPLGSRETDQSWQEKNYTTNRSKLPNLPFWSQNLVSP